MDPSTEVDDIRDLQFKHPFNAVIAGPSGSGKTVLLRDILEQHKITVNGIDKTTVNVVWCYGVWQNLYEIPLMNVSLKYIHGIPDEEDIEKFDIIVLDDLMVEIEKSKFVSDLFTRISHHNNQSIFLLTQNLYHKGPIFRTLNINTHYLVIFNNPRDKKQVCTLAQQASPYSYDYFMSAYDQATDEPHGYLIVDCKQSTPKHLKLRGRIIPNKETNYQFLPLGFKFKNV